MSITKKEFIEVQKEILEYFNVIEDAGYRFKYSIDTVYGVYSFMFSDNDTIFGRFEDVAKMNSMLPAKYETINGALFKVSHYPNIFSGKMNFHFNDVYDFIDTLDRLVPVAA